MMLKALKAEGFPEMASTQLRLYADEYRRGTFTVHAPNNVVKELAGREPEDFETFTRRVVATRPEAVRSVGNKLKAIRNFMKIALAAKVDGDEIERRRDHVLLKSPTFVGDSQAWREKHDPDAGYIPDQPHREANTVSLVPDRVA